ncbi:MAG: hypothetical protein RLY16_821 [Bacteroidota bacterium]
MTYHKLLERQLKKITDAALLEHPQLQQLFKSVHDSYESYDKDKELSSRAFSISEHEYQEINKRLKDEVVLKKITIDKLKEAIRNIETDEKIYQSDDEDNLLAIVNYLDEQINKRKEAEIELLKAKEEAEQANSTKSEFLSVMSHEIRTPLHAVIGMGHLLMNDNPRPDQLNNLKILRTASENLLVLINDILDFSKIEAGKIDLESADFNIKQLIADVKLANSVRAQERGNKIKFMLDDELPSIVKGDSVRLGQILTNLVSNAIKFTRNGAVNIEAELLKLHNNNATIKFSVTDTGVGIAPENLEKIFQTFTQASSSITREFGGTGLGLTITRRLLNLMGSEIMVSSELGKGSSFYFTLEMEINPNATEEVFVKATNDYDLTGIKILLVEDTPFNILYATQLIEGWHAKVEVAENGLIAIEKAKENQYNIILMDLQMPEMDGYTATQRIRQFNNEIPILALTASATSNVKEKTYSAGMNDYITKPFNPDEFYQRIKRYVS